MIAYEFAAGCDKPTAEAGQNRRLLNALLTAVTTKNRKELDKEAALWGNGWPTDFMPPGSRASTGRRWGIRVAAEDTLYKLRESDPFPR